MKVPDNILSALKAHYDKLIAFVMLLCLILSLLYLAVQIGRIQERQRQWDQELSSMKPAYPESLMQDEKAFQQSQKSINEPLQIANSTWTNKQLFVPEMRVWCEGCRWPIPYAATNCPFCEKPQSTNVVRDTDGDLMLDSWEDTYGLNKLDPTDANKDKDEDGFSNLEEFEAGTDPTDAKSRPELPAKLRVDTIVVKPFMLKFRSVVTGPDGFRTYGLNKIYGNSVMTFFKKIGQDVGGYKLVKYEEKSITEMLTTSKVPQRVDKSELTLVHADKIVVLVKNVDAEQFEYTAKLYFLVTKKEIVGKVNDAFDLQGEKYKILRIDRDSESVVIEREQDGKQFKVRKLAK